MSVLNAFLPILRLFAAVAACLLFVPTSNASPELADRYGPDAWQARRQHAGVEVLTVGEGPTRAYVFMPDTPRLQGLPLVLFHHGWLGMNPKNFGGLIDLLVRRGVVLIYPVYQDGDRTPPQNVTELAAEADAKALAAIDRLRPGLVDRTRTLYWGFSMGAGIALNFALAPERWGLPPPRAMLLVAPGDARHVAHGERGRSIVGPVEKLPADLPVLLATGAADTTIGVPTARALAARLCHLPATRRNLILFPSDANGGRNITAGHGSPGAPDSRYDFPDSRRQVPTRIAGGRDFEPSGSLNLLDYYGYWRITMRLVDYVAGGDFPAELFSRSAAENRFLGTWPDGTPYAEAWSEDPCPRDPKR